MTDPGVSGSVYPLEGLVALTALQNNKMLPSISFWGEN